MRRSRPSDSLTLSTAFGDLLKTRVHVLQYAVIRQTVILDTKAHFLLAYASPLQRAQCYIAQPFGSLVCSVKYHIAKVGGSPLKSTLPRP